MQKRLLLFILLLLAGNILFAQMLYYNQRPEFLKANSVWAFGSYAGLDFNNGGPVPIRTATQSLEGCASVADPVSGKLLFYSNGGQVWNANHQKMLNGDSLLGNANKVGETGYVNFSTRQGVCIVPVIGDPAKYYLFSLRGESSGGALPEGTLFYSVVDMKLENGLGAIVPGQKNIALNRDYLSEAMVTVPGNNCDVWLIVHASGIHEFKSYHITKAGIDTTPVVSTTNKGLYNYIFGNMAISPDRSKIVMTSFTAPRTAPPASTLIAEFNPATGAITNEIIYGRHYRIWDVCFSPDNSKLYISGAALAGSGASAGVGQLDLTVYDSATIANSLVSISPNAVSSPFKIYNDTIYFISSGAYIGRINQPNLSGSACGFQKDAIGFEISQSDSIHLHNALNSDVVFPLPLDTVHALALDTSVCPNEFVISGPQGFDGYTWEDGSSSINRKITIPGIYWVLSKDFCNTRIDTFIISGMDLVPPVINIDERTLGTVASYSSYEWMLNGSIIPGATDSTYTVSGNGEYQVIIANEMGCLDTSEVYHVTNFTGITEGYALREQIRIYPNPANSRFYIDAPFAVGIKLTDFAGKLVKEEINTKVVTIDEFPNGIYLLNISDKEGLLLKIEKLVKTE